MTIKNKSFTTAPPPSKNPPGLTHIIMSSFLPKSPSLCLPPVLSLPVGHRHQFQHLQRPQLVILSHLSPFQHSPPFAVRMIFLNCKAEHIISPIELLKLLHFSVPNASPTRGFLRGIRRAGSRKPHPWHEVSFCVVGFFVVVLFCFFFMGFDFGFVF